jgi:hypothetical protein
MKNFITSDRSLQAGDIVLSTYNKSTLIFRITDIERRFLEADDLKYHTYKNANIGDEYNPIVTIESVGSLDAIPSKKKVRKVTKFLDASYLIKVTPQYIEAYIKRLDALMVELWP